MLINRNLFINIRALYRTFWHVTSWIFTWIYHFVCYRKSLHHVTPKWVVLQCYSDAIDDKELNGIDIWDLLVQGYNITNTPLVSWLGCTRWVPGSCWPHPQMVAADWTTPACVQVGSQSQCRLGPQLAVLPGTATNCMFYLFFGQKLIYTTYRTKFSPVFMHIADIKATNGVPTAFSKNACIRLKLQKKMLFQWRSCWDPTCTALGTQPAPKL